MLRASGSSQNRRRVDNVMNTNTPNPIILFIYFYSESQFDVKKHEPFKRFSDRREREKGGRKEIQ